MRLSALFLVLPFLAETAFGFPSPRRHGTNNFKRIYGNKRVNAAIAAEGISENVNRASTSEDAFTGIPVATSTPDLADLMPVRASASVSAEDPRLTGNNTVPAEVGEISESRVSRILAATSAFEGFEYTTYVAASSSYAPTPTYDLSTPASTGGVPNAMDELEQMAKSKANAMLGQLLPTLTLEVILEPTQVSSAAVKDFSLDPSLTM